MLPPLHQSPCSLQTRNPPPLSVCVCVSRTRKYSSMSRFESIETCCSECRESKLYLGRHQKINMEDLLCLGLILVFLSDDRAMFVIFGRFTYNLYPSWCNVETDEKGNKCICRNTRHSPWTRTDRGAVKLDQLLVHHCLQGEVHPT